MRGPTGEDDGRPRAEWRALISENGATRDKAHLRYLPKHAATALNLAIT
jgi:hypothetical protein